MSRRRRSLTGTAPRPALPAPAGWLGPNIWAGRSVGAVAGYAFGHWVGNLIAAGYPTSRGAARTTSPSSSACRSGWSGWLAGGGDARLPPGQDRRPRARSPGDRRRAGPVTSGRRSDHKVIGLQYAIVVFLFLFTGGLLAMAIRTELLNPTNHIIGPGTYIPWSASTGRS